MSKYRKRYTFYYRIYRRLRYLRYVRKLRKAKKRTSREFERQEVLERNRLIKEQERLERESEKQKKQQDRHLDQENRELLKEEQRKDLLENADKYRLEEETRKSIIKKERWFKNHRRKRMFRFYLKVCRKNTISFITTFNPVNLPILFRYIRKNRQGVKEFFIISIHSTLLFTASYLMIFLIRLFTQSLAGVFFDFSSIIYFYETMMLVKPDQWFADSVKMIYGSPPIVAGILAIFLAIVFAYVRTEKGLGKLFILWSFLHGFNAFFGSLLFGSIFNKGIGYAIIWSYISDTEKVIYSIVSITALFLLGIFTTKSFLISANSYYPHLEKHMQRPFIWAQVIIPFLAGNALLGLIMFPKLLFYDMTVSMALLISIVPIAVGYRAYSALYFEEERIRIRLQPRLMLYAIVFILLYRIVLGIGIPIG